MKFGRRLLGIEIQRQVIMQAPFHRVACARPLPSNLQIRRATPRDLPALWRFANHRSKDQLQEWISRGHFVVMAERTDRVLVGYCCLSKEHVYPKLLSRAVPLVSTDAWHASWSRASMRRWQALCRVPA